MVLLIYTFKAASQASKTFIDAKAGFTFRISLSKYQPYNNIPVPHWFVVPSG
jgi:hypothetical protein